MPTVNEKLLDGEIHHQVDLTHYSNGVMRRIMALLNRTDPDLFAQIGAALERLPAESFTVDRLEALLGSVRYLNQQAYDQLQRALADELLGTAQQEADFQAGLWRSAVPAEIQARIAIAPVNAEAAYAAAMARPFQGRLLREFAAGLGEARMLRMRDAIRIGYVEQQTVPQIVQRLRGTRAKGYSDGLIEIDRRNAESVVRTAVGHVAGFARDRFMEANSDLIKAEEWVSTLDSRTSEVCRLRDGKQYTPVSHKPIGHSLPWLGGPGRAHWGCRSSSTPITKSWRELGLDMDDLSPATRASMDGEVPAEQTYGAWLRKQSASRQDEILGPARGKLFRAGMPIEKFANDKGRWLTLDELRERNEAVFEQPQGQFTIYDPQHPKRKPSTSTPARQAAVALEDAIRGDGLETGAFFAKDGGLLFKKTGRPDRVTFTAAETANVSGALFTHNHPNNGSFSRADVVNAANLELAELRAAGPTLRHLMTPSGGWPSRAELDAAILAAAPQAHNTVSLMIARGDLEPRFAQAEAEHQVWVVVSKKFRLGYRRERS